MSVSFEEAYVASKLYVQEHNDLKNRFVQPLKYKEDFLSEELDFVWFRNLRTTIANVKQNYMQETIPADFLQLDRDIEAQAESLQRAFNSYVHTVESNAHKAESKNKLDVLAKDIRIIHKFADEYNFAHPKFIEVERDIAIKYNHMLTYPHEYGLQKKNTCLQRKNLRSDVFVI